ncbi:hypothetical protein EW146_g6727 [Bondarzewia mesenterica]|uniref:Uncharacterized protein n=1 Tax=Bondarzewia mesenterica TaxID=1095465 RepID=A0A4S4LMQ3_9AGAM|nr:hypothetical protein EW146_g6727 [Bondarzewia mesenterica]
MSNGVATPHDSVVDKTDPSLTPAEDDNDDDTEEVAEVVASGPSLTWIPCDCRLIGIHLFLLFGGGYPWGLGEGKKKKKKKKSKRKKAEQSDPPRVGLSKIFPDGNFPEGEIEEYRDECVVFP